MFLLLLTPMLTLSCDKESCDNTTRNTKSFDLNFSTHITFQDGRDALDAPITVYFQKHWCDGSYSIVTSHSGNSGGSGFWFYRTTYSFELANDFDYVYMKVEIGNNPVVLTEEYTFYYNDIILQDGTFHVVKEYTLNF